MGELDEPQFNASTPLQGFVLLSVLRTQGVALAGLVQAPLGLRMSGECANKSQTTYFDSKMPVFHHPTSGPVSARKALDPDSCTRYLWSSLLLLALALHLHKDVLSLQRHRVLSFLG